MHAPFRRLSRALAAFCLITVPAFAYGQGAAQAPAAQKADASALPTARSIIDKHLAAVGGRKAITAHKSHRVKGTMSMPANGMSGTLESVAARPNKIKTKVTLAGVGEIQEGFDGTHAWTINPMTGPSLATGAELEDRKFDALYDNELKDEAHYESLKTVEKTTFDGRPAYKIAVKRKGAASQDFEYYDAETGLKIGVEATRHTPMGAVTVVATQGEYKKFGNLLIATLMKQKMMGVEQVMTISSVEFDVVDPAELEMPAAVKALVK